jgi:hypothetical protein
MTRPNEPTMAKEGEIVTERRPPPLSAETRQKRRGDVSPIDLLDALHDEPLWSEVTQTILHNPALSSEEANSGRFVVGNCMQACVASVMKMPIEAVPHFAQFLWWPMAMELWLRGFDLTMKGERTTVIPDRLCIVGGQSPRGVSHVVVGYGGQVVWDPHPSREGLVSIRDVTWFEPMGATAECWFCHVEWAGNSPYADAAEPPYCNVRGEHVHSDGTRWNTCSRAEHDSAEHGQPTTDADRAYRPAGSQDQP